jgi:hypothetical protein
MVNPLDDLLMDLSDEIHHRVEAGICHLSRRVIPVGLHPPLGLNIPGESSFAQAVVRSRCGDVCDQNSRRDDLAGNFNIGI